MSLTAARVMGFRRPIAHGMWTLSRVLAWIDEGSGLDEDVEITCVFKKPVLIPGRIELTSRLDGSTRHVSVLDPSSGAPHLTASVVSRTASSRG